LTIKAGLYFITLHFLLLLMHSSGFLKVFLIISAISLLLDWYVYYGLKIISQGRLPRFRHGLITWGYLIPAVGITVLMLTGLNSFTTPRGMRPYHEWVLSIFLTFLVTKIMFSLVLFLGDAARFFTGLFRLAAQTGDKPVFPGRRKFISEIAVFTAAIPFTAFFYAMLQGKYDYKLHKVILEFADLPDAFNGFTITQLSDIHSGSFDDTAAMQKGINLAKAQNSDLFVFTGDLVNNAAEEIEPYLDHFGSIKAPYGQFSILGNHDYGDYIHWDSDEQKAANLDKLKEHHKTLGYRLLLDEAVTIKKDGQEISLIGVQNWGRGFIQLGNLNKALANVPKDAFKILLSHDPTHWEEKVRYHPTDIHLTLSGHTHGAQFGVETDSFRWSPVKNRYLDWAGLANEKNRYLYVNRGFGFLAFSGRLGIWPEVTVITLKKKTA